MDKEEPKLTRAQRQRRLGQELSALPDEEESTWLEFAAESSGENADQRIKQSAAPGDRQPGAWAGQVGVIDELADPDLEVSALFDGSGVDPLDAATHQSPVSTHSRLPYC